MEVWFYLRIGTAAERPTRRAEELKRLHPRSSRAHQEGFLPLDKDLSWKSANRRSQVLELYMGDFAVNQALSRASP